MNGECIARLTALGITEYDARQLRRIAMTLHRWHELECGIDGGCIEREGENGDGRPFWTSSSRYGAAGRARQYVPDREKGARKRLGRLMVRYPELTAYVQGDPRGAALYVLRPGDVPAGGEVDAYYNRGVAVYK